MDTMLSLLSTLLASLPLLTATRNDCGAPSGLMVVVEPGLGGTGAAGWPPVAGGCAATAALTALSAALTASFFATSATFSSAAAFAKSWVVGLNTVNHSVTSRIASTTSAAITFHSQ